jgi:alcohol dehydrogenase (cytochrome c)
VISATPLVVGGRVFVQTLESNVYALDERSGRLLWAHHFGTPDGGPNGLASGYGRLYGATSTTLFALDPGSGRLLWSHRLTSGREPIDIAPAVAFGLVYTSTTGPYPGGKGTLIALDAASGRVRWRLSTIAKPWANPRVASGGGAWWTPTLSPAGALYVGIANPLPWGGTPTEPNGAAYAGAALYTDSLLVLDARTGRLEWYDQVTPHDVRDYDFSLPPMLLDAAGKTLVIGAGKSGRVIAWDTATHARVWSASVGRHLNDQGPLPSHLVTICPGLLGGALTPMAASAGRVFVPVVNLCMRGSAVGYQNFYTVDYAAGTGELVALAAATGHQLWVAHFPSPDFGCATTAGGVVFTATYDGSVYGLSARTGAVLWRAHEPAGINACPAIAGTTLIVAAGAEPLTFQTPVPVVDAYRVP